MLRLLYDTSNIMYNIKAFIATATDGSHPGWLLVMAPWVVSLVCWWVTQLR